METMVAQLGPNHPTVQDARSEDVETAARGIVNLYEIARASSATVREAKETVKKKQRKAADEAREDAVVSSAGTSRAASEKARSVMVTPGLTLAQLDEEFEAASSK
jgi:cell envelope opacity-associated protein A